MNPRECRNRAKLFTKKIICRTILLFVFDAFSIFGQIVVITILMNLRYNLNSVSYTVHVFLDSATHYCWLSHSKLYCIMHVSYWNMFAFCFGLILLICLIFLLLLFYFSFFLSFLFLLFQESHWHSLCSNSNSD